MNKFRKAWSPVYDIFTSTMDAFIPEVWAQAALLTLENTLVASNLVHRNFEEQVQSFGDTVNARQLGTFRSYRKTADDTITKQATSATNVPVVLNQHFEVSFIIKDADMSLAFADLVSEFLQPAIYALANDIDRVVIGQVYQFMDNYVGNLGTAASKTAVVNLQQELNENQVPLQDRICLISPATQADLLNVSEFSDADKLGDEGTAVRNGSVGRLMGIDFVMTQNVPGVTTGLVTKTSAINLTANYAAGSTSLVCDAFTATDPIAGEWCTIAGDDTPQKVTAYDVSTLTLTISPGLRRAVVNNAVVTVYDSAAINLTAGYASGYSKDLVIDGITVAPRTGQLITFGTEAYANDVFHAAIGTPTTTSLFLDRPTEEVNANNAVVGLGPVGDYNFAFNPAAVALVVRPLTMAPAQAGARMFTANFNGLSLRVTLTYDHDNQGTVVTVDCLAGVKVLNTSLGAIMYS